MKGKLMCLLFDVEHRVILKVLGNSGVFKVVI